jgi:hypothetical protein
MSGMAVLREVRQNLSYDTTELKTMAGKTTGDDRLILSAQ